MTRTTYLSDGYTAELAREFESALDQVRNDIGGTIGHLVGGQDLSIGTVVEGHDPSATCRVVSKTVHDDGSAVAVAVAAAAAAAPAWRATAWEDRVAQLDAATETLTRDLIKLAALASTETGKTRFESVAEIEEVLDFFRVYGGQVREEKGFDHPLGKLTDHEHNVSVLRPFGVFGIMSPFNFPAALTINMTLGALYAGNTAVVKPSPKTPRTADAVLRAIAEAVPTGVVNIVHGDVAAGQSLINSPVDGFAFTGSTHVGMQILQRFTAPPFARPVLAEMGGKNSTIVTVSADLDAAAEGIARSAFGLSGQKCSACSRVLVDRRVASDLIDKLQTVMEKQVVGDPSDAATTLGPVIDQAAIERFGRAIQAVQAAGAEAHSLSAGVPLGGHYVPPTVVTGLPEEHALNREELFLPFVTVTVVDGLNHAIHAANAVHQGLTAGIFSGVQSEVDTFFDRIEAGVLYVNRREGATTGAWPGVQAFCGWKASGTTGKGGLGTRYLPGFAREQSRTTMTSVAR